MMRAFGHNKLKLNWIQGQNVSMPLCRTKAHSLRAQLYPTHQWAAAGWVLLYNGTALLCLHRVHCVMGSAEMKFMLIYTALWSKKHS